MTESKMQSPEQSQSLKSLRDVRKIVLIKLKLIKNN